MVIWMLSALIIAFLVSCVSGKLYIPWLKKRGFVQHLDAECADHSFFGELCFRKAVYSVAEEARLRTAAQG